MFDVQTLENFYKEVSATYGVTVTYFQDRLKTLFEMNRSEDDLKNYRLGKGQWKKFRDEITPVSKFLQFNNNIEVDQVRFPLDNNTPDCWLLNDKCKKLGIEVTIARGRERFKLMQEMNKADDGIGRGFIGIQDDASQADFDKSMSRPREAYTTDDALKATKDGIIHCLSSKNDINKYKEVFYLLIQSNLSILAEDRWNNIKEELSEKAENLPFQEIYVICSEKPWGFQLK